MEHVYFPTDGLVSVAAKVDHNRFLDAWLVGREGVVGAILMLSGHDHMPAHRRIVHVGGNAIRIPTHDFLQLAEALPAFRHALLKYLAVVMVQTSQAGVCNAVHPLKQRLARWLLVACEVLDDDHVPLTHQVLSNLLGVRRASVTECVSVLEQNGLIRNERAHIIVADPAELRKAACACFGLIEREYARQLTSRCDAPTHAPAGQPGGGAEPSRLPRH
ncbi:putative transcriptional regulator, Crp/Fnr family [Bradyrhizobium sp. STM 3809]|nr:putative transcriptional regulator, Crp/Fnr family [Bradyrhizobium sp. STM 3809]